MNLRPLGYETNDTRLRRPAQSLVTSLASANLRQQVSRGLACLPHLTASRPVRFTNPFTDPVPWPALIPPTTLAHRLIVPHHRASLTPEIPVGSTRLASPRRDGPRRITQGQSDGVSHQSRAPRAQGPVPSGTRISKEATARHRKLSFDGPEPSAIRTERRFRMRSVARPVPARRRTDRTILRLLS